MSTPTSTIFGVDEQIMKTFDLAWRAHVHPDVQKLHSGEWGATNPDGSPETPLRQPERFDAAVALAKAGRVVDISIDGDGGSPYLKMLQRTLTGVQSIEAAFTGVSIPTTLDPSALTPYPTAPAPPPASATGDLVGAHAYANIWFATQHAIDLAKAGVLPDGYLLAQDNMVLRFGISQGLMGKAYLWERK